MKKIEFIQNYKSYVEVKYKSKATRKIYMTRMYKFIEHCTINLKASPSHINKVMIREYLTPLGDSVYNQSLAALQIIYFKILNQPRKLKDLTYRKSKKKVWKVLSKDDIVNIITHTYNKKHKAIISLLYFLGIRKAELLALELRDIDRQNMCIHIKCGKGAKDRRISISEDLLRCIEDYYRSCIIKPTRYLFQGQSGKQYSETSVSNIVKKHESRIGKAIWPHLFRHSIATHMINDGVNILEIMRFLGHSSIRSTERYYQYLENNGIISISREVFDKIKAA